jgi:hypothetical protein
VARPQSVFFTRLPSGQGVGPEGRVWRGVALVVGALISEKVEGKEEVTSDSYLSPKPRAEPKVQVPQGQSP